jgi:hypothetical protein
LSNLGVLASFYHSHMTNKQEYKQKKVHKQFYQQYVKLDFCGKWSIFGRFVIKWLASKKYLLVTISLNIFELLLC